MYDRQSQISEAVGTQEKGEAMTYLVKCDAPGCDRGMLGPSVCGKCDGYGMILCGEILKPRRADRRWLDVGVFLLLCGTVAFTLSAVVVYWHPIVNFLRGLR